jgi:hypothetical protein
MGFVRLGCGHPGDRTHRLKPGTRDEFVRAMWEESLPLPRVDGICGNGVSRGRYAARR